MQILDAIAFLRGANWAPGVSTAERPDRDRIKAALAACREHRVDVGGLGLVYVPPPPPEPLPAPKERP